MCIHAERIPAPVAWRRRVTMTVRYAAVACAVLWWCYLPTVDAFVAYLWDVLLRQWWFRHDSFEPALSTVSFFVFLLTFAAVDVVSAVICLRYRAASKVCGALRTQPEHQTDADAWRPQGHAAQELLVYITPIFALDYLYPRRAARLAAAPTPTSTRICAEIIAALFLYDLFFTITHYIVHKVPYLYSRVHAKHHERSVIRARDTVRLSVAEEVIDVLCSVIALNVLGAHPLSRGIYDIVIVYLLCELHSGWDLPWQMQHLVPCGIWGGSVQHTIHHTNPAVNYQKFFTYLDRTVLRGEGRNLFKKSG
eukprot:TRINITY_DN43074_c0_g1_i1.p1 TRINITY_DN43074_c0_g1~~TRINITY_DN43074_c0_g1_i1.p1  ORF type:complete len:308 (+),score=18.63 TRINITY_DN43074_c0_g1_i1:50-973(+)